MNNNNYRQNNFCVQKPAADETGTLFLLILKRMRSNLLSLRYLLFYLFNDNYSEVFFTTATKLYIDWFRSLQ